MEILTIIGINFAIAMAIVIGAIVGYKKGVKQSLVTLIATLVIIAGVALITPLITAELLKIGFVQQFITPDLLAFFKTVVFAVLSLILVLAEFFTVDGIFKRHIIKKLVKKSEESKKFARKSTAKVVKTRRQIRQERRAKEKSLYKTRERSSGVSKFFGLLIGIVVAVALVLVVYLPIRERNKVEPIVGFETNIIEIVDNGTLDKIVELL